MEMKNNAHRTVLFIDENFEVLCMGLVERLNDLLLGLLVSEVAPHERASRALLHDLALVIAREACEALIAVDHWVVDDLRVCQQECVI